MVTEEKLAYIAGLLDGDGYVSIMKSNLPDPWQPYYQAKIGVAQLWPGEALRLIRDTFGGEIAGPIRRDGGRPIARWEIWNVRAASIVSRLLPHLRVKRRQASLLIEAQKLLFRKPPAEGRKTRVEEMRVAIMNLNRGLTEFEPGGEQCSPHVATALSAHPEENAGPILPYLAGIMDSDGNFKIERRKNVKGMLNPHYRIAIRASQVAPSPAVELFAATFGGNVKVRGSGGSEHRPLAHWSLYDRSAEPVIAALLPYLVIKAPEARLLLRLRELKAKRKEGITEWVHKTRWQRPVRMRKRCYSADQVREFDRLYLTLRALHAGVPPLHLRGFRAPTHGALTGEEQALLAS